MLAEFTQLLLKTLFPLEIQLIEKTRGELYKKVATPTAQALVELKHNIDIHDDEISAAQKKIQSLLNKSSDNTIQELSLSTEIVTIDFKLKDATHALNANIYNPPFLFHWEIETLQLKKLFYLNQQLEFLELQFAFSNGKTDALAPAFEKVMLRIETLNKQLQFDITYIRKKLDELFELKKQQLAIEKQQRIEKLQEEINGHEDANKPEKTKAYYNNAAKVHLKYISELRKSCTNNDKERKALNFEGNILFEMSYEMKTLDDRWFKLETNMSTPPKTPNSDQYKYYSDLFEEFSSVVCLQAEMLFAVQLQEKFSKVNNALIDLSENDKPLYLETYLQDIEKQINKCKAFIAAEERYHQNLRKAEEKRKEKIKYDYEHRLACVGPITYDPNDPKFQRTSSPAAFRSFENDSDDDYFDDEGFPIERFDIHNLT